jgi:hypothetical protein
MPTNIRAVIDNLIVNKIIEENAASGQDNSPTAQRMQDLATAAILTGQRDNQGAITPEWRAFMVFLLTRDGAAAADPADLARLVPETNDGDAARQKERAYLVGNGMCGTGTGDAILLNGNPTVLLDQ